MLERRTFIVRVYAPDDLPIVEDAQTGELVRLPDLTSIADEIRRRLHGTEKVRVEPPDSRAPPEERP